MVYPKEWISIPKEPLEDVEEQDNCAIWKEIRKYADRGKRMESIRLHHENVLFQFHHIEVIWMKTSRH